VADGKIGRLAGVPFVAKDNFLTFGSKTTAASKILSNFAAPLQATVIERLEAEGAVCIGKANLDSFAHGGSTENSAFGVTHNAVDAERVAGGSSGGSAVVVAKGVVPFALGSDTGGSIRQPASFNGVVGYKPTYGMISRYGVVAMASSTDVVGPIANSVADVELLCEIMAGQDGRDSTVLPEYFKENNQTKIIFVRHGQTEQNVVMAAGKSVKEDDYPLNETGIQQVKETAEKLKNKKIDLIISSPYLRAMATAEIINEFHGAPLEIETDFRERSAGGVDEKVWHTYFDMDTNLQPENDGGENLKEFFDRVYKAIDRLKERYAGKTICVVAHGGVNHGFYAYFNKLEWKGNLRIDRIHNAGVREYVFDNSEKPTPKNFKIGLISEFMGAGVDTVVKNTTLEMVGKLREMGHTVEEVSLPMVKYALPIYYIVVPAEVSSNLARYDGVRYGARAADAKTLAEVYGRSRDEGFVDENKRRIMIGSYVLSSGYFDAYYLQAQKARTLLIAEFDKLFAEYDFLIGPTAPTPAFRLGENTADPLKMYMTDIMTVPASLAGLPALSIPAGADENGLPIGVQIIGRQRDDARLLDFAKGIK
jgi:Asp-tRNA(Asn)/Glu-tRNA(Gln) amidotransferase A subunit family amidase